MSIDNPYQPPRSRAVMDNSQDCRREGKYAFVPKGRDLPPRCIICNAEAVVPIKQKTMYWHSPWLYFLILLNILIYAFIAILNNKGDRFIFRSSLSRKVGVRSEWHFLKEVPFGSEYLKIVNV